MPKRSGTSATRNKAGFGDEQNDMPLVGSNTIEIFGDTQKSEVAHTPPVSHAKLPPKLFLQWRILNRFVLAHAIHSPLPAHVEAHVQFRGMWHIPFWHIPFATYQIVHTTTTT